MPASPRSDGVRVHPGTSLGCPSEYALSVPGIPKTAKIEAILLCVRSRLIVTVLAAGLILSAAPRGSAAEKPEFEVAAVKPVDSTNSGMMYRFAWSGEFTASASLQGLIRLAYGIRDFQLVGAPGWVSSD